MTAYEIYRVRTALKEREMVADQAWRKLQDCNDPEKGKLCHALSVPEGK